MKVFWLDLKDAEGNESYVLLCYNAEEPLPMPAGNGKMLDELAKFDSVEELKLHAAVHGYELLGRARRNPFSGGMNATGEVFQDYVLEQEDGTLLSLECVINWEREKK